MTTPDPTTTSVVQVRGVTRIFGKTTALDSVTFDLEPGRIHGLLGRNGAGKTTLMQMLAGHDRPSSGQVRVFGHDPYEHAAAAARTCFVREGQRYPDEHRVCHVIATAAAVFANWDADLADSLLATYKLPMRRKVKKLSRGMQSALGITLGLASRAPLTIFDEPYLGLDAVARQMFYDQLLTDVAEHPRTVILSTHLIDEIGDLLDRVLVIDDGKLVLDEEAETLRGRAFVVTGPAAAAEDFADFRPVLHRERLGGFARITLDAPLSDENRSRAHAAGLEIEPISLQQLVIHTTGAARPDLEESAL
ncbi:ABC transporter ATP-binding protein [Rhodococcus sp. D2-41]|uniref:ABC transporter ATP-binding protein n=1 Tax=Speluncibacter jeojiensis TaxID=2710754 RepID=UPI00240F7705|nr:ABC transporter ATP-binding protein [Rhodococcus sp. D2-41]MDG3010969.1 ABC transporter ATP-binding protein [Rhodococcus sp. D2-41]